MPHDRIFTWKVSDSHPTTISTDLHDSRVPQVSGDRVVWTGSDGSNDQIFTWKSGDATPAQLTHDAGLHGDVQIDGDRVAWDDLVGSHSQIFTWKVGDIGVTTVTVAPQDQTLPQVSGDRIVWVGFDGSYRQVRTWKAGDSQPTTVTSGTGSRADVQISDDRLVLLAPVGPYTQVLTWKVGASSPTTLTFDQKTHVDPCVSGNRVVWLDYDDDFDGQVYSAVPVCSLTIKTSASSCKVGKQFVLSGLGTPSPALVGRMMHVDVKKPGKSYWSYSSNRIVYAGAGGAASWQYKYTLKSGMAKGTYQFRAVYDADDWYAGCMSTAVKVVAK